MVMLYGRRGGGVLPLLAAMLAVLVLAGCNPQLESQNVRMVNDLRARSGVPALRTASDLTAKARAQADRMADQGRIFHSSSLSSGVRPGWRTIGENVAVAGTLADAQRALERSAPHLRNMTNRAFNEIGVGVTVRNGRVYVVQVFVGR
jgi:uncharacterized protein YkwD